MCDPAKTNPNYYATLNIEQWQEATRQTTETATRTGKVLKDLEGVNLNELSDKAFDNHIRNLSQATDEHVCARLERAAQYEHLANLAKRLPR